MCHEVGRCWALSETTKAVLLCSLNRADGYHRKSLIPLTPGGVVIASAALEVFPLVYNFGDNRTTDCDEWLNRESSPSSLLSDMMSNMADNADRNVTFPFFGVQVNGLRFDAMSDFCMLNQIAPPVFCLF